MLLWNKIRARAVMLGDGMCREQDSRGSGAAVPATYPLCNLGTVFLSVKWAQ